MKTTLNKYIIKIMEFLTQSVGILANDSVNYKINPVPEFP